MFQRSQILLSSGHFDTAHSESKLPLKTHESTRTFLLSIHHTYNLYVYLIYIFEYVFVFTQLIAQSPSPTSHFDSHLFVILCLSFLFGIILVFICIAPILFNALLSSLNALSPKVKGCFQNLPRLVLRSIR